MDGEKQFAALCHLYVILPEQPDAEWLQSCHFQFLRPAKPVLETKQSSYDRGDDPIPCTEDTRTTVYMSLPFQETQAAILSIKRKECMVCENKPACSNNSTLVFSSRGSWIRPTTTEVDETLSLDMKMGRERREEAVIRIKDQKGGSGKLKTMLVGFDLTTRNIRVYVVYRKTRPIGPILLIPAMRTNKANYLGL